MPRRVERPFNGNKWTNARYFGFIRSALRKASQKWPPIHEARKRASRPYRGPNKRQKWEYQCANCKKWWSGKEVEVDHIVPAGTLRKYEDLPEFARRLLCEVEELRVLCKQCHQKLTRCQKTERKQNGV